MGNTKENISKMPDGVELKDNALEAASGVSKYTPTAMHCENCLYGEGGIN